MDETKARELQDRYLAGDQDALGALYVEMRRIARLWAAVMLRSRKLPVNKARLDAVAHDSATRIAMQYMGPAEYRVYCFYERIRLEVFRCLFHRSNRRGEDDADIDEVRPVPAVVREERDKSDAMQSVLSGPEGERMVVDMAGTRWYRDAITKIALYVPKPWIYAHATELHTLYRMTRCPRKKRSASR